MFLLKMTVHTTIFKINPYLSLEFDGRNTAILVNGEPFTYCKRLLVDIPSDKTHNFDGINSIDELSKNHRYYLFENEVTVEDEEKQLFPTVFTFEIAPEDEFWGHCSNLQAWYEHNYDTRIIHSNLAFPLLRKLSKAGDPLSKRALKDEIAKRLCSNYFPTIKYLIVNHYFLLLSVEELLSVMESFKENSKKEFYFKIIADIASEWKYIISRLKNPDQEISELTSAFAFVNGLLRDPEMTNYCTEYFLDPKFNSLNNDLQKFLYEYKWICGDICYFYNKREMHVELIDFCKSVLERNENVFFLWKALTIAYDKIGLPDYASLARKIFKKYQKQEKKIYKKTLKKTKLLKLPLMKLPFKLRFIVWNDIKRRAFLRKEYWDYYFKRLKKGQLF